MAAAVGGAGWLGLVVVLLLVLLARRPTARHKLGPGDLAFELIDGVPHAHTAADAVDLWPFT